MAGIKESNIREQQELVRQKGIAKRRRRKEKKKKKKKKKKPSLI